MNNLETIIHDKIKINKSNKVKKIVLLFISSILDVIELSILPFYTFRYKELSTSLQIRLCGSVIILNVLPYYYILKLQIFKHQILSLIIIFGCLICTVINEYFFQIINGVFTYWVFTKCLFVYLLRYSLRSTVDIIDKYFLEFESFDPFLLITIEGISSSLITFLFFW